MSKKPSSSPAPAGADRSGAQLISTPTSPPPATGGTHLWNPSLGVWETVDETIQPWDERHPDNLSSPRSGSRRPLGGPAPAAPETPLKDA